MRPAHSRLATTALAAIAATALTLPLAACSGSGTAAAPRSAPADTLVYATGDAEPTCLDPHVGGNFPQALLGSQVLESLVGLDEKREIVPWLAEKWQRSSDGLTWDFTLKPGLTFTDGTPVDAAAVKANIEHLQDPKTASSTGYLAVQQVKRVEVVSPTVARFHLVRPDAALLESLAQPWVGIESPKGIARGQEANCLAPVGTGPFTVAKWTKQDRIELTRNPDYRSAPQGTEAPPKNAVQKVVWRFIPDATSRYAALQSGEVDVIDNPLPDQIAQVEKGGPIAHVNAPRPGASNRIELNTAQAPFDDERVRKAFIASVNVNAAVDSLFEGTAERSSSALSSVEPLALQSKNAYVYNPRIANDLLDEAGWTKRDADGVRVKDGKRLEVRFPVSTEQSVPAEQALFQQLQAGAKEAGFDVKISLLDLSSWYGALGAHEYEMVSAPYTKIGPDVLRFLYHSDATVPAPSGYFANHAMIKDPQLDRQLDIIGADSDPTRRAAAAKSAQERIAQLSIILPLYDQQNHFLFRSDLRGFRALPTVSTPVLADAIVAAK